MPFLAALVLRLIYITCKKEFKGDPIDDRGSVVVFWHGRLAMMSFIYAKFWRRKDGLQKSAKVIISDHKDGEFIVRVIEYFGIGTIRGSSSKGGVRAVAQALKELKSGVDVIITPDGPRGPRHSVALGAAAIAIKAKAPVYALNYEADRFWQFKSWDKMILPKPFSKITFSLSPLSLSDDSFLARREIMNALWCIGHDDGGKSIKDSEVEYCEELNLWAQSLRRRKKPLLLDEQMAQISHKISEQTGVAIDISDPYGSAKNFKQAGEQGA
ncbi:hypothetical protein LBC_11680 [Campylobacter sp. 19-13652]|nr:hypothetical protein LBC_11680 [Campylobacter sp. 19-13652]